MRDPLRTWSAVSALLLLTVTYRLWLPFEFAGGGSFPLVPLFAAFIETPLWVDGVLLAGLVGGWCLLGFSKRIVAGALLVGIGGVGLVLLDQHRFQPWHYQLMIFAAFFMLNSRANASSAKQDVANLTSLRWFVASIYVYSAWSKVDYEFLHTVGQQFLSVPAELLGFNDWSESKVTTARWLAALCIPLLELLVGVGVLFQKTRRLSGICACLLHLGLVILLGPLGLNHSWGVLLWNVHFIGVAYWLFVRQEPSSDVVDLADEGHESEQPQEQPQEQPPGVPPNVWSLGWAACVLLPVIVLPALERFTFWDHWPSWALYAPHSSRVDVEIAATAIDRLPVDLQRIVEANRNETEPRVDSSLAGPQMANGDEPTNWVQDEPWLEQGLWVQVPLSKWSLESQGVPIYPQARFQAGVAMMLSEEVDSPFEIRVHLRSAAARMSGQRKSVTYTGKREILKLPNQFRLNCIPRFASQKRGEL